MRPAGTPKRIHVLAKPTGSVCNLNCSYCFYLKKESFYPGSRFRMSADVLDSYIRQLIESHESERVAVAWQGGEPTLMGIDFFKRALALQEKYRRPGMVFDNTLQTNGILLNDQWCELLHEHKFLVGISLDGPRNLHDAHRVDKSGKPTFERVMNGIRLLRKHGIEYNILVTVNRLNADYPLEVYRFLRDEVHTTWIQFIPMIERISNGDVTPYQIGSEVSHRTVGPRQWGTFLKSVFDEWIRRDVGRIFVQTFEAAVRNWLGMGSSGMCVFDPLCGHGVALEHNGDLYSCDHFVEPEYLLGNIKNTHMMELVSSDKQKRFGRDKLDGMPGVCKKCTVRFACHGECPKNRFIKTPDGEHGLNYLCEGYKDFFNHVDKPLLLLTEILKKGFPASKVMDVLNLNEERDKKLFSKTGRNELCPCGSGLKFKKCHGSRYSS